MEKIFNEAIAAHKEGRLEDAERLYWTVLKIEPSHPDAHNNLGIILHMFGRLDEAEKSCNNAIQLKPDFLEAHYNLGNTLKELGRLNEAELSFNKVIELKPDYAEAYHNLGNILIKLNRFEHAEVNYKKVIKFKSDFVEAYHNLGVVLFELGRIEEGLVYSRKAIELKPDYAEAHNNLGILLKNLGKLDEAKACYKKAIGLKIDYADAHYNLGVILIELDKLEDAETSLKKAIELKPDFALAYLNRGKNLKILGNIDKAVKCFEQVLKICPDDQLGATLELARIGKRNVPNKTPKDYLQNFYRTKSKDWVKIDQNKYHGHKLIKNAFKQTHTKQQKVDILDLGCGTGSLASFFHPYARKIVGVDLSKDMIVEAKKKDLYDILYNKELDEYLKETTTHYDLVVAAAVMIHFFDLENTFTLIRNKLKINGKFLFSVFEEKIRNKKLNSFLMYSHSDNYITTLADKLKFKINYRKKGIHEYQKDIPVNALIYVFEKSE